MTQDLWVSLRAMLSQTTLPISFAFPAMRDQDVSATCFYLSLTSWVLLQKQSRLSSKCWSLLDHLFVSFTSLNVQFYSQGLGDEVVYKACVKRLRTLVRGEEIVELPKELEIGEWMSQENIRLCAASFLSPIADVFPPQSALQRAHIEIVCPADTSFGAILSEGKPIIIHLPGTGDEHFSVRRVLLAKPLAMNYGITSIILQVPFYGARRAAGQKSFGLDTIEHTASQILGIVMEANAIVRWLYDEMDFKGTVGFTGISFGGAMTALSSLICPYPHVAVGHVPSCSREDVFVHGVLSRTIQWSTVEGGKAKVQEMLGLINTADFISEDLLAANVSRKYPIPPRVYHQLTALDDQYVLYASGMKLHEAMKQVPNLMHQELELLYGGHVSAIVLQRQQYLESIARAVLVLGSEYRA